MDPYGSCRQSELESKKNEVDHFISYRYIELASKIVRDCFKNLNHRFSDSCEHHCHFMYQTDCSERRKWNRTLST